jgi:hypothetical protein
MGANRVIKQLLAGLTLTFLLTGCTAGATPSPSAAAIPTTPGAVASPTPTPAPTPTRTPSLTPSPTVSPTADAASDATGCVSLNIDYAQGARGKPGDPAVLARTTVAGLRADDAVEPGKPAELGTAVQIVRAGEVIGKLTYVSDKHGGWLLAGGWLCGGLGVASSPEPSAASGPPAGPTGATYRDDRWTHGVAPDVTVTVAWKEAAPDGVSIWVYGVTECLVPTPSYGVDCVTKDSKIPASALVMLRKVPAAPGTTSWTYRDRNIEGAVGAYGSTEYYGIILRAVNAAGRSPFVVAGTAQSCNPCTY